MVWNLTSLFPVWPRMEKQWSGSKPLWAQFGPFQNERCQNGFKRVWNLTSLFPIWTRMEKQGSGSKPLWDQFGLFQKGLHSMKTKPFSTLLLLQFQLLIFADRGQLPNPFKIILAPFSLKCAKMVLKWFGT